MQDEGSGMFFGEHANINVEQNEKVSTTNTIDKGRKRNNLACTNCRKRHIKCDGHGKSCTRCINLKLECVYLEADKKVVISVKYLDKLQNQISKLKVENANLRSLSKNSNVDSDRNMNNNIISNTIEQNIIDSKNTTKHEIIQNNNINEKIDNNISNENYNGLNKKLHNEINNNSSNNVEDKKNQEIIPPFLEKYGRLIHSRTGERLYIGSSSMTLFGLEINRIVTPMLLNNTTNNKPDGSPESDISNSADNETILEKEGNAYRIMLGKTHSRPGINVNFTLPSYSYAMLLVDSFISYNDGCFYFFNEGLVKENLRRIYNDENNGGFKFDYGIEALNNSPQNESTLETIWFCKLLLIFAIGEMYLGTANFLNGYKLNDQTRRKKQKLNRHKTESDLESTNNTTDNQNSAQTTQNQSNSKKNKSYNGTKLPGSGFFNQASDLFTGLFASGSIDNCTREGGIEVLLLYAFYLQVADCTAASYFYFGIALRASLLLGLHVDIGKDTLNRFELEHRRRLWWTVYMYERMLASKAGLPLSLTDEDISTELPNDFDMSNPSSGCENYIFPEAEFISNCVRITKINANILRKLYTRQPSSNILPVVHELVVSLLRWKKALPNDINCDYSQSKLDISRLVVNMMTEYFQGINLAVRPLLFHFVLVNLKSNNPKDGKYLDLSKYSSVILALLNASFQASINTIRSLWALVPENMVAMFGYMDREYLFNATATLVLFNATFGVYAATKEHLDHALILFTKMRNLGNHPATLRREQILKLLSILDFNGSMSELINKHNDNLNAPLSSANLDKSFGHKVNFANRPNNTELNNSFNHSSSQNLNIPKSPLQQRSEESVSVDQYTKSHQNQFQDQLSSISQIQQNQSVDSTFNPHPHQSQNNYNINPMFNQNHQLPNNNTFMTSINSVLQNQQHQDQFNFTDPNTIHINNTVDKEEMPTPNLLPFSPSLSLMFNQIDNIPEFEQLTSTSNDLELWKDVTDQAAWLQNDVGGEFNHLLDQNDKL
jgi:proline utilization trans-activator